MSRPKAFTSASLPFVDATLPAALSAAFAASRMATMFASVSGGGAAVERARLRLLSRRYRPRLRSRLCRHP
jgi:hypothetical protein